jgi:hypothetical protein
MSSRTARPRATPPARRYPRGRTFYRVLADPDAHGGTFFEEFFETATAAFTMARHLEAAGRFGVEVSRVVVRRHARIIDLLNRQAWLEGSEVIPPETWRKRVRPGGRRGKVVRRAV